MHRGYNSSHAYAHARARTHAHMVTQIDFSTTNLSLNTCEIMNLKKTQTTTKRLLGELYVSTLPLRVPVRRASMCILITRRHNELVSAQ